jgi:cyclophilin family peptidyl-prolyl cis-trans isomerase
MKFCGILPWIEVVKVRFVMKSFFKGLFVLMVLMLLFSGCTEAKKEKLPDPLEITHKVVLDTSVGKIVLALYGNGMPETVKNFVEYVENGFYEDLIFHRVVKSFVIQGGGFSSDMVQKETKPPVKLEMPPSSEITDEKGRKTKKLLIGHEKYALAMARTRDPNSATSQFYITLAPQKQLDPNPEHSEPNGYAVFGKVVEGFDVVDKIGLVEVGVRKGHTNVPVEPVKIIKVYIEKEKKDEV